MKIKIKIIKKIKLIIQFYVIDIIGGLHEIYEFSNK